jgi:phenylpropionate dioxygenase-like ring-hydroxylating dioxygenase large terminal subunit
MNHGSSKQDPAKPADVITAPPVHEFPAYPASWYLFCRADQLSKPLSKRLLGRQLVAFKTRSGKICVMAANCSHMGADLGCGTVIGESIQCPFHNWKYGTDGTCHHIPGTNSIPAFARQANYPVEERHGYVFFFNGPEALFPLPFFEEENPADFVAGKAFSDIAEAEWFMIAAQGFDAQHFQTVHDRRLLQPPHTDSPSPFTRRNRWYAEIIGEETRDRVLRRLAGKTVNLTINNWGGTVFTVKAEFPRACSRFLVFFRPLENKQTYFETIVYSRRGSSSLGLAVRRWFTRGHLFAEAKKIRDTQYRPARFVPADTDMVACFKWLAELPQFPLSHQNHDQVITRAMDGASQVKTLTKLIV